MIDIQKSKMTHVTISSDPALLCIITLAQYYSRLCWGLKNSIRKNFEEIRPEENIVNRRIKASSASN